MIFDSNHCHRQQPAYEPAFKCLLIIIVSVALSATSSLCTAKAAAQQQTQRSHASTLVTMPCMEDNRIVLTRTHELGVFSNAIGNRDNLSDTYRVFPFHLIHPAKVQVDLHDKTGSFLKNLIAAKRMPAGNFYFVLSYQDVRGHLPDGNHFSLRVRAAAGNAGDTDFQQQIMESPGILMEKYAGDALGRIIVHDVLIHRGRLCLSRSDFKVTGRGPSFEFSRTYSNQPFERRRYTSLGQGWQHNHERFLHVIAWGNDETPYNLPQWVIAAGSKLMPLSSLPRENRRPRYVFANGGHFKRVKNRWISSCTRHGTLEERKEGFFFVAKDGTRYFYPKPSDRDMAAGLKPADQSRTQAAMPLANLRYTLPSSWPLGYIQDRNGNRLTPEYAQTCTGPLVTAVCDAVGRRITFEYDPPLTHRYAGESEFLKNPRRLSQVHGPDGIKMNFEYFSGTGLLKRVQQDVRHESYTYSSSQTAADQTFPALYRHYNLIDAEDANGHATRYQYCRLDDIPPSVLRHIPALNPFQAVKAVVYPDKSKAIFKYDDVDKNQRTVIDLRGNPTIYVLNRFSNPVKQIEPLDRVTAWTWQLDEGRNDILKTSKTDILGQTTHYEYDLKGNVTREKRSDDDIIASQWDPRYSILLSKSLNGRLMEKHTYDDNGNCLKTVDENGRTTRFEYNSYGELIRKQAHDGRVTQFKYDHLGNLKQRADNSGYKVIYKRDERGRLLEIDASDGRKWVYTYDTLDQVTYKKEPDEPALQIAYDPKGNAIRETYDNEQPIIYRYDSMDRIVSIQVGNQTRAYVYDNNGNIVGKKDFNGQITTHRYNALNEEMSAETAAQAMQLRYRHIYNRLIAGLSIPPEMASSNWDQQQKAMKAKFLNQKGVFFYDRENYHLALKYFCRAVRTSNHTVSYLKNALSTFNRLERYQQGLDFYENYHGGHKADIALRSWHAWFLDRAEHPEEAVDIYASLFSQGYRNEEDFQVYTDLLYQLKRYDTLDKAFEDYIAGGRSEIILMSRSKSLYKRKKYDAALKILEDLQKSKDFDPDIAIERIRNYRKLRQYDNVRRTCLRLIDGGYASADAYYYKGDAEYMMKWLPEAKKSLEQALALAPKDKDIKEYIDHIAGRLGQGDNTTIKEPIAPVPMPKAFAARLKKKTTPGTAPDAIYRCRLNCYHFSPGKPVTQTWYREVKILNAAGVATFSTMKYDFNPLHENIYVNKLIVKDSSGKTIASGNPDDFYVMDTHPDDMATYDQTLYLPVPSLAPGTTIELAVTKQTKATYDTFPFKREVLVTSYPIQLAGLYVGGQIDGIAYESTNTVSPSQSADSLLWVIENRKPYRYEPEQVDYEHFLPIVYLSAARQNWAAVGKSYFQTIAPRLALDDETRRLARSLAGDKPTRAEQMDAVTEYVRKTITYKPLEFGTRGIMPNTAAETIEKKYGDCKDHAVLLQQLLTALDIPAHLVLVDTKWAVRPKLPSSDQFNHMIVCAGAEDEFRYIDATEKGMGPGQYAPSGLAGRLALVLDPKAVSLKKVPAYTPAHCRIESQRQVSVQNIEDLQVVEKLLFNGYMAAHMRSRLKSMDSANQKQWIRRIIAQHHPDTTVASVSVDHLFDNRHPLSVQIDYTLKEACEVINHQVRTRIPSAWEDYYLKVQPVEKRTADFEIAYPLVFESQIEFKVPPSLRIIEAGPYSKQDNNTYGSWQSKSLCEDSGIKVQFSIRLTNGTYPASKYENYRQAMAGAIKAVNQRITLKK